jgi:hypothetical protein
MYKNLKLITSRKLLDNENKLISEKVQQLFPPKREKTVREKIRDMEGESKISNMLPREVTEREDKGNIGEHCQEMSSRKFPQAEPEFPDIKSA